MKRVIVCFVSFLILSCKSSEVKQLSGVDSAAILESALNNRQFVKEEITHGEIDTIFFLKSKHYNNSWPKKTDFFTILYIEDTPQAKLINKGPRDPYDKRTRIGVPVFTLNKDTVDLSLFNFGINFSYNFKLVKDKEQRWKVVGSKIEMY